MSDHKTRYSDSSLYDEVCIYCGATDARGSDALQQPCPSAPREEKKIMTPEEALVLLLRSAHVAPRNSPRFGEAERTLRQALQYATVPSEKELAEIAQRRAELPETILHVQDHKDVLRLLAAINQRDNLLDDARRDAGSLPQDALPADEARSEVVRLREVLKEIVREFCDDDHDDWRHIAEAMLQVANEGLGETP